MLEGHHACVDGLGPRYICMPWLAPRPTQLPLVIKQHRALAKHGRALSRKVDIVLDCLKWHHLSQMLPHTPESLMQTRACKHRRDRLSGPKHRCSMSCEMTPGSEQSPFPRSLSDPSGTSAAIQLPSQPRQAQIPCPHAMIHRLRRPFTAPSHPRTTGLLQSLPHRQVQQPAGCMTSRRIAVAWSGRALGRRRTNLWEPPK
jgi:hypothetical protein